MDLLFKGANQHYSQMAVGDTKDASTVDAVDQAEDKNRLKSVRLLGNGQFVSVNACQEVSRYIYI